jgi:uncharacterized metal-binding protein
MPDTRTHDIITVATGALLAPAAYVLLESGGRDDAAAGAALLTGAHLISGLLFSPDLDIDSAIDNRWGFFFWIWRPYMWLIPHRHFWSHSLVFAPLLRLVYFYLVALLIVVWGAWLLGWIGVGVPDLHTQASAWLFDVMRRNRTWCACSFLASSAEVQRTPSRLACDRGKALCADDRHSLAP